MTKKAEYTPEQVEALARAMRLILEEMSWDNPYLSTVTWAHARVAFEPFYDPEIDGKLGLRLDTAQDIIEEENYGRRL